MTVCFYNAQSVGRWQTRSETEPSERVESIDVLLLTETASRCHGDEAKCVDLAPAACQKQRSGAV